MQAKVQRWGNSLAVRIPKAMAIQSHLTADAPVELRVEGEAIVLRALPKPRYTLDELLQGMTKENSHGEISWGKPEGNEVW